MALRKHHAEQNSVDDERELLREQREVLDSLRRQLAERVQAVEQREQELLALIAQARAGNLPAAPDAAREHGHGAAAGTRLAEVERRERAVAERERAVTAVDETTAETAGAGAAAAALAEREQELQAREEALARRVAELTEREAAPADPAGERDAEHDRRLAELRDAETQFLRTRQELADRSEAVAARERLVSQRERELDDREDSTWERSGVAELESRLRRLEQAEHRIPDVEQTQGFSGGFRKLQEEGTRRPPDR